MTTKLRSLFVALACNSSPWGPTPSIFAFSTPSIVARSSTLATKRSTRLHDKVNKDEATTNQDQEQREPSTGWNHSVPKTDSEFWAGKREEYPKTQAVPGTGGDNSAEHRTGWLHSTPKKTPDKSTASNKAASSNMARKTLERAMKEQKVNHRIIAPPTFHPVAEGRRAVITEHKISVPLNRYNPPLRDLDREPMVDVYFSIVELVTTREEEAFFQSLKQKQVTLGDTKTVRQREQKNRASDYKAFANLQDAKDCLIYLQGGPGFGAPQPINGIGLSDKSSWVGAALSKGYKRIVLMDQRGTGKSTPITKQTLEKKFPNLFGLDDVSPIVVDDSMVSMENVEEDLEGLDESHSDKVDAFRKSLEEATQYMTHFRADNIVNDAEAIKAALLQPIEENEESEADEKPRPYGAALGQSFGGFCMMTYLSLIPNPPNICLLTGGIAPMLTNVDDVYAALRERVKERNLKYFEIYPEDVHIIKRIVQRLEKEPVKLPSGGILTARRFLMVGIGLGGSPSAFSSLHNLFSSAFVAGMDDDDDDLSRAFLKEMDSLQPFDDHPIYFLLHESIYADGASNCAKTEWSAYRAYNNDSTFNLATESSEPNLLTGEVIFPWMTNGAYAELSGMGMRALAQRLANKEDWRDLYNSENMRKALAADGTGVSKAAAAVYYDDMYVDFNACMKVTQRGNPLENCKVWVSNEYQHSGLRDDGAMIFQKLLGMAKGEIGTPS